MKKLLTLLVAGLLAVTCCFGLTACGDSHEHNYVGEVISKGTCTEKGSTKFTCECGDTHTDETPALGHAYKDGKCIRCQATAPQVQAVPNLKVGLICLHDTNSTYDKNFIDAFEAACTAMGIDKDHKIISTGIPEGAKCKEEADAMVAQGCKLIFADSFGHEPYLLEAAKAHPEVQFFHATGTQAHTVGVDNFHDAFASIYEGRYLAGYAAGLKLNSMKDKADANKNFKVGYIGAFTYAEVISGFTSWFLGVQAALDEGYTATMDVQFTGSWYDETGEKEAANTLIDGGCVLISQHADSWGAPTACEAKGVPNVSYNGSTESQCPNTFIVSSRINWQPYFEYIFTCVKEGKFADTDYCEGLGSNFTDGSVCLTDLGKNAPAEGTNGKITAIANELRDGTRKVFDCSKFTVGGKHLTTYLADVDDFGDYVGETEAIKTEGNITYFAESEFRSAPYFDIQIDGINYLNVAF